jgi:hypothetical protein
MLLSNLEIKKKMKNIFFFSIITPRRSIASRRIIRKMIEHFEKVKNFGLLEYKA